MFLVQPCQGQMVPMHQARLKAVQDQCCPLALLVQPLLDQVILLGQHPPKLTLGVWLSHPHPLHFIGVVPGWAHAHPILGAVLDQLHHHVAPGAKPGAIPHPLALWAMLACYITLTGTIPTLGLAAHPSQAVGMSALQSMAYLHLRL